MAASFFPKLAATLFAAVALAHVARIAWNVPVTVGDAALPMAASWVAAPVFAALALWGFRDRR
jgi:hypothetical protein